MFKKLGIIFLDSRGLVCADTQNAYSLIHQHFLVFEEASTLFRTLLRERDTPYILVLRQGPHTSVEAVLSHAGDSLPKRHAYTYMGVSENRGPQYSTLNSRILIIRTPK